MKPAIQFFVTVLMAVLLCACESVPLKIWESEEKAEPKPAPAEPAPEPKPVAKPKPTLYQQIENDIAATRLSKPKGNNAIEKIEKLRRQNPNDPAINKYKKAVIDRYLGLVDKRLKRNSPPTRNDLERALRYINTARSLQIPSAALDVKEEEILELLDILVQREQLEKARREAAKAKQEATPPPAPEVAETPEDEDEEAAEAAQPIDNPNFLSLPQGQIDARAQEINLQLDSISSRIISENAAVIIHARSMDDFRYLNASLRTSLYWVDPDFVLTAEPHISDNVAPGIEIISY